MKFPELNSLSAGGPPSDATPLQSALLIPITLREKAELRTIIDSDVTFAGLLEQHTNALVSQFGIKRPEVFLKGLASFMWQTLQAIWNLENAGAGVPGLVTSSEEVPSGFSSRPKTAPNVNAILGGKKGGGAIFGGMSSADFASNALLPRLHVKQRIESLELENKELKNKLEHCRHDYLKELTGLRERIRELDEPTLQEIDKLVYMSSSFRLIEELSKLKTVKLLIILNSF